MKTKMRTLTTVIALLFGIGAILLSSVTKANIPVKADDGDAVVRWDIINLQFPFCPAPGGNASATTHHNDNSTITLTGSGTFEPGHREEVTGGGTWTTASGSGTYRVTELVSWHQAPGVFPSCNNDTIPGQKAAGLAVLRIRYNDRSTGVLTVSCRLIGTLFFCSASSEKARRYSGSSRNYCSPRSWSRRPSASADVERLNRTLCFRPVATARGSDVECVNRTLRLGPG